jgi:hypothetical protein
MEAHMVTEHQHEQEERLETPNAFARRYHARLQQELDEANTPQARGQAVLDRWMEDKLNRQALARRREVPEAGILRRNEKVHGGNGLRRGNGWPPLSARGALMTYEQMLEAKTPTTFINEPIIEAESATARAQRLWFDRREQSEEGTWRGSNLAEARQ